MFEFYKADDGRTEAIEYLPCSAITPKAGMALMMSSGKLAIATGTNAPTYISLFNSDKAVTAGTMIPVSRVSKDVVYKTTNSASLASVNIGTKVTIATDGLRVTATATDGVAEVVGKDADAAGSDVYVRF